jgi:hypothetical protein
VGINSPTTSTLVSERSVTVTNTDFANNPTVGPIDVSHSEKVRVVLRNSLCVPCSQAVEMEVISAGNQLNVVSLPVLGEGATAIYEVPGTEITLRFRVTSPGTSNTIVANVFGRP